VKKFLFCLLVSTLLAMPGFAQENSESTKPSREQVVQFLDLMQAKQRMVQMIEGMKAAQKKGAEEAFKHLIPDAKADQIERVDALADETLRDMPLDEMFDAMIPIYQRHLTSADLDAAVTFYHSPAGQKILKEQPAMVAEGMQAGQDIMLKRLPDILDRLNTRIAKLADEELKTNKERQKSEPVKN